MRTECLIKPMNMEIFEDLPRFVVDASVFLKPVLKEEERGTPVARAILNLKDNLKICVFVPDIFRYELNNTLIRKKGIQFGRLASKALFGRQLCVIPLEDYYLETAQELQRKYPGISFYDASYHALAIAHRCPYITADKKYYERTRKEGRVALLEKVRVKGDKLVV